MCGRYYWTYTEKELFHRYLKQKEWPWSVETTLPRFTPNYNMCPTQSGLVLRVNSDRLEFSQMQWGLLPAWAKSLKEAKRYLMINARSEEIDRKKSFFNAFRTRRCLVPVSGFYEWQTANGKKKPFAIRLKDRPIMSLAGIWECWIDQTSDKRLESFALVTTSANQAMQSIHNRMPVIVAPENEEAWLNAPSSELTALPQIMQPCPSKWLEIYEVRALVNSPRNNSCDLLLPLEKSEKDQLF
jgi:putative SOS response-associated peptidase YedK